MAEVQEVIKRSRRRSPPKTLKPASKLHDKCSTPQRVNVFGRTCPEPNRPYPAFLRFRMVDAEVIHSNKAFRQAGFCPHCVVDFLRDAGFFQRVRNDVFICDFSIDSPSGESQRNGLGLIAALFELSIPQRHALFIHSDGGRA